MALLGDILVYLLLIVLAIVYSLYKYTKESNIERKEEFEREVLQLICDVEKKRNAENFIENWLNLSKEM